MSFKIPTALRRGYTLMLRTCDAEMRARHASAGCREPFAWPRQGPVEAPDWSPEARCGGGLHGLLRGSGDGSQLSWEPGAQWLVVEVRVRDVVPLGDKVKVPRGRVLLAGARSQALALMAALNHLDDGHVGGTATAGDGGTATAGDGGTATAGTNGTLLLTWWDEAAQRRRTVIGYIGEAGIEPGKRYRLDDAHQLAEAPTP